MGSVEVKSELIGTVWKVDKSVGGTVNPGDTIMILESMKMEFEVTAPTAGKLTKICVSPDDSVEDDQVLFVIEE